MPLCVCISILALLRVTQPRDYVLAYGMLPGVEMLHFNLSGGHGAYLGLLLTFGALPLLPVLLWKRMNVTLKVWALLMLVYGASLLYGAVLAETRLLLLPFALVVLPCLLLKSR
jgi:hypothetical protein